MSNNKKNILTFKQDDKFYYQRAMKLIDNMEFLRGIKMLNIAIKQKPDNIDYRMDLCELLTDIGHYSKSIDEVINIMVIDEKFDPRCYYMLGINYYELGDYVKALNMFERYLSDKPEGDMSEEVFYFLENIEQFTMSSWQDYSIFPSHIYSTKSDITNIDETRMSDDLEIWTREQNVKALMAYSKKEYAEASKICRMILNKMPRKSSVLCTLALSLHKEGKKSESIELAKELSKNVSNNIDDLFRVSFVLCELKMDSEAKDVLLKLKTFLPFSEKINHYLAVAHYNCGDYENARRLWNICYEINDESHKYQWYIDNAASQMIKRLEYTEFLPAVAVLDNITYLESKIAEKESNEELKCWEDIKFKKIVLESLEKCNDEIQFKLLQIIFNYAGDEREAIFRKFLLSDYISEKNKNEILSFLHHIGAKEPFLMMTDYQLVDVAINVVSVDNNSKDDFIKVLNYAVNNYCSEKEEKEKLITFWSNVAVKFMVKNKRIKNVPLWAAGFYLAALNIDLRDDTAVNIIKKHELSKNSLQNVLKMIDEIKGEKDDY